MLLIDRITVLIDRSLECTLLTASLSSHENTFACGVGI